MSVQSYFRTGLLDPDAPVPTGLENGANGPAGKRYDVYRNNVTHSLIDALQIAFPLVYKLLGGQTFARLAPLFVRAHPPTSPLMMFYGVEFPVFLDGFAPLSHIGYLPDAARLDLALRTSYHAADAQVLTSDDLQAIHADALTSAQFLTTPATIILRSPWPLFDIWQYNFVEGAAAPTASAQDVLITRPEFDPIPHLIPVGGADWFEALTRGESFETAHETALAAQPDFDLAATLTLALSSGALKRPEDKELK